MKHLFYRKYYPLMAQEEEAITGASSPLFLTAGESSLLKLPKLQQKAYYQWATTYAEELQELQDIEESLIAGKHKSNSLLDYYGHLYFQSPSDYADLVKTILGTRLMEVLKMRLFLAEMLK